MIPKKNDWELTKDQFESQRMQLLINLACNSAVLDMLDEKIENAKDDKEQKK